MNILLNTNFPADQINNDDLDINFTFIQILRLTEIEILIQNTRFPFIISVDGDLQKLEANIHVFFDTNYYFFEGCPVIFSSELLSDDFLNQFESICKAHGYDHVFVLYSKQSTSVFNLNPRTHKLIEGSDLNVVEELILNSRFTLVSSINEFENVQESILKKFNKESLNEIIEEMKRYESLILNNQWIDLQLNNHKQYIQVIKNRYGSKFSIHFFINKNNKIIKTLSRFGPLKIFIKSIFNVFNKILR